MKMLLVTDRTDAMLGLRLAGVETALAKDKATAEAHIKAACENEEIGILLITSEIEKMCADSVNAIRQAGKPLISTVPDSDKSSAVTGAISEYIANAIGINGGV